MVRTALMLACTCWSAVALAQGGQLADREIRDLVSGATIAIDTPLGTKIPVRYTPDGKMNGEAAGSLATYLGAAQDSGTWWIAASELCHRWNRWFDRQVQCLSLSKHGRSINWRNRDGRTGTASVIAVARIETAEAVPSVPMRSMPEGAMRLNAPKPTAPAPAAPIAGASIAGASIANSGPKTATSPTTELTVNARKAEQTPVRSRSASDKPSMVQPPAQPPTPSGARQQTAQQSLPRTPSFIVANVARGDVLYVRSGPSAEHDVVGSLEPGIGGISLTGTCRANWCPITLSATDGWVNRRFLEVHDGERTPDHSVRFGEHAAHGGSGALRDSMQAPRGCLTQSVRALLDRIEGQFGPVRLISTCRAGATIAGTGRPSRHASGNAVDFDAGSRKAAIIEWLIAHHHDGGTMTYPHMDHIHVDIGPRFVSIAGGRRWASWRN